MYDPARDTFTAPTDTESVEQAQNPSSKSPQPKSAKKPVEEKSTSPQNALKRPAPDESNGATGASTKVSPSKRVKQTPPKGKPEGGRSDASSLREHKRAHAAPTSSESGTRAEQRHRSPSPSRKRGRSPSPSRQRRRSPSPSRQVRRRRSPTPPFKRRRSPTPPARSPPRERKRPGAASRIALAEKEAVRQRQLEREVAQASATQVIVTSRGVHDAVLQHYNAVPQRGREWRRTDSRIRGLRSYNNWVKSALIQKFSPREAWLEGGGGGRGSEDRGLLVLDIGCGKGGDLGKWQKAPQPVELYVGVDPAGVSIEQARERYEEMSRRSRGRLFQGEFFTKDGYGEWIGDIELVQRVGVDGGVGPGGGGSARWGGGGFDVVTMMFCMHYAFESEAKARGMLRNVAGALKKGGRFIGVIPNSDVLRERVAAFHADEAKTLTKPTVTGAITEMMRKETESETETETAEKMDSTESKDTAESTDKSASTAAANGHDDTQLVLSTDSNADAVPTPEWGNSIYRVRFPGATPADGIFRPPFGWKYSYFMEEAVEEVPEYVVPWEAFRALAEDYNLELQYRRPFLDIWAEERDDTVLGPLSARMGVTEAGGQLALTEEEREAVAFYHAFCFYKV